MDYVIFKSYFFCVSIKQFYIVHIKSVGPTVNLKGKPISSGKRIWYDVALNEGL